MKEKIKKALRQEYKTRLELNDDQLNGVAAFAATFVTDEGKIEEFVKNQATYDMLKSYQSMLDKDRERRKGEGGQGQQGSETGKTTEQNPGQPDIAKIVAEAVAIANKPIMDELNAMKAEKAVGDTIATVEKRIDEWGYGKGYPKEMAKARRHAMKLFEANGKKWTADQLEAAIKEEFNEEVDGKGLDTTKPFHSDGGGSEKKDSDESFRDEVCEALGIEKK